MTDARQRFNLTVLNQIQHGLVTGFQLTGDLAGRVNVQGFIHSLAWPLRIDQGHGATHALTKRGEFRETGLAEMPNPTIGEMAGRERRPSIAGILLARLKSNHSGAGVYSFILRSIIFSSSIYNSYFGRFHFHHITAFSLVIRVSCSFNYFESES
jgi:hypothetical protein